MVSTDDFELRLNYKVMTTRTLSSRRRGTRPGLTREQSRELTRIKLLTAGRAEFAAHGLQGANLTDILRRAEVSPGAFYHHFQDKLDLFLAVVDEMSERFREMLRGSRKLLEQPGGDIVSWIAGLYKFTLQQTRENRELFLIYLRELNTGNTRINEFFNRDQISMRNEMRSIIEEMQARGFLPNTDADWGAYLVGVLAQGGMLSQLAQAADDDSWSRAMAEFTLGGIRALSKQKARPPHSQSKRIALKAASS